MKTLSQSLKEKQAKSLSMDIISTLPETILDIILCCLPTKQAARTSILSRDWRYKWLKIPKLKFYHDPHSMSFYMSTSRNDTDIWCKSLYKIHQVLLRHQGPLHELTLHPCVHCESFEFDRIVFYLAKNHTIKKLTLEGFSFYDRFDIPISVFSLRNITDLDLCGVTIDLEHQPSLNEFGRSLRSIILHMVGISTKSLLHLLSYCQSLKSFYLCVGDGIFNEHGIVFDLFKCLPAIEDLTLYAGDFQFLPVSQELPLLFNLRYFCFKLMSFSSSFGIPFFLFLIKYSPNLEKIQLEIDSRNYFNDDDDDDADVDEDWSVVMEKFSDIWLDHLMELEIVDFNDNLEPEIELVKFILARSPILKTLRIDTPAGRKCITGNNKCELMMFCDNLI